MWDDYWRNGNNYYLFWDEVSRKWFFIPYDYDITFFDSIFGVSGIERASFLRWGDDRLAGNPVLMDRVLAYSEFRQQYEGYIRALYDPDEDVLHIGDALSRLEDMREVVEPHVDGYDARDEVPYQRSHAEILNFIQDRTTKARSEVGS